MLGVFLGGFAVARLGLMRALLIGAFAGPVSNLVFVWLATQGHSVPALFVAIGLDNAGSGFAGTALIAYMSSLTAEGFTATQYALFSSLYALPGRLVASQSDASSKAPLRSRGSRRRVRTAEGAVHQRDAGGSGQGRRDERCNPAALGAGYIVFFIYSTIIGVFAIVLAIVVAARQQAIKAKGTAAIEPTAMDTAQRARRG